MSTTEFCISWDSYKTSVSKGFTHLQQNAEFVDMTLAAEDHLVKVHQNIVALASPYLKAMLQSASCQHPVIFLSNISHKTLEYLLEYIYSGEVKVPKNDIATFLEACKGLHICGVENFYLPKKLIEPDPPGLKQPEQQELLNDNEQTDEPLINHYATENQASTNMDPVDIHSSDDNFTQIETPINRVIDLNENDVDMDQTDFEFAIDKANMAAKQIQPCNNPIIRIPIETSNNVLPALFETPKNMPVDHTYSNVTAHMEPLNKYLQPHFEVKNNNLQNTVEQCFDDFEPNILPSSGNDVQLEPFDSSSQTTSNFAARITINNGKIEVTPVIPSQITKDKSLPNILDESGIGYSHNNITEFKQNNVEIHESYNDLTLDLDKKGDIENISTVQKKRETKVPPIELKDNVQYYSVSNQGSQELIFNRYIYLCHQRTGNNYNKRRWRCRDYRSLKCRAFIDTEDENIVKRFEDHNHAFHDNKILKQLESGKVFNSLVQCQHKAKSFVYKKMNK